MPVPVLLLRPRWLCDHPMRATSTGACQVLRAECCPPSQPSPRVRGSWWQQRPMGGPWLAHTTAPKLRRVPAVESHRRHLAFGPAMPSAPLPPSLSPQYPSPPSPAHGCRALGLLKVPGYTAGAEVVSICPCKRLPLSFLPANMRTLTRTAIQSASLIKIATHPSSC